MVVLYVCSNGRLHTRSHVYRCALGRNGIRKKKREGDGFTPAGRYPIRRLFYRADRLERPNTNLPAQKIKPNHGWCDDPSDSAYNQAVVLPYKASAESMWRQDGLYDLVVILGHNDNPTVPNAGSAIFLHVASCNYDPTEGCVAVSLHNLQSVLLELDIHSEIQIDI